MKMAAERLLVNLRHLAPEISARAKEIEAGRRIPPDLVEKLKWIGVFRMLVPHRYGGLELTLPDVLQVVSAAARIEGAVGWVVMIGCGVDVVSPMLGRDVYEHGYRNGPDVIHAGSLVPAGTAEKVEGGWRVNGRWPFASGCQHAEWLLGLCVTTEGGRPILKEDGTPMIRGALLPAHEWQIEDTWHAAGLKGTGSHHIALTDKIIPDAQLVDLWTGEPCVPGPLYQAPHHLLPLFHAAFSVGAAEGALDDLLATACTGRQQLHAPTAMKHSEVFQYELARVAADVRAARAFLQVQAESHWQHALAGTLKGEARALEGTQAAIWLSATCVGIADACFRLGGGLAVYESSPLQRRLRDLHASAQHVLVQQRNYVAVGKALLEAAAEASRPPAEGPVALSA